MANPGPSLTETTSVPARGARAVAVAMWSASAVAVVGAGQNGVASLATWTAPAALFAFLGWAAFWRPEVQVGPGGIALVNILRTVTVRWPAVTELDGRYGLIVRTPSGRHTAWGATAPRGRERRAPNATSPAAEVALAFWHGVRDAGWLDSGKVELPHAVIGWHRRTLAALAVLGVLSVASLLLGS